MKKSYLWFAAAVIASSLASQTTWAKKNVIDALIDEMQADAASQGQGNAWGTYRQCFVREDGSFDKAAWFAFKDDPANRHMGPSDGSCPNQTAPETSLLK